MRLLAECPECSRQYDVSRRKVGSRFRCYCGDVVTVRQPRGHEAAVVRCSSCGAARPDGAARCPYCESDFTLHERDLNTVCPHCLARVSDRARFCHHCGVGLIPEQEAGAETDLPCPACQSGPGLVSRQIGTGRIAVLECGQCAGFWLGHDAFRLLVERAKSEALPEGTHLETPREVAAKFGLPPGSVAPDSRQPGSFYRPCPFCRGLMNRRNYGRSSGVIIDLCKEDGIWFDAEELARILVWVRSGGVEKESPEERARREAMRERFEQMQPKSFFARLLESLVGGSREDPW